MKHIFVFGSNTQGIHGAGAALAAKNLHGAIQGIPMGLQGNSYAIITKHLPGGERSVALGFIKLQVATFISYTALFPNVIFSVTRIGCGHAGFKEEEIAPMFQVVLDLRLDNIMLCPEFLKILHK